VMVGFVGMYAHKGWLAESIAEIRVVGIGKFPQHYVRGPSFRKARWISDVERVEALSTLIQSAYQYSVPGIVIEDVSPGGNTVYEVLMGVTRARQILRCHSPSGKLR